MFSMYFWSRFRHYDSALLCFSLEISLTFVNIHQRNSDADVGLTPRIKMLQSSFHSRWSLHSLKTRQSVRNLCCSVIQKKFLTIFNNINQPDFDTWSTFMSCSCFTILRTSNLFLFPHKMHEWLVREEGWNGKQAKVGGAVSASFQRMSPAAAAKCNLTSNHNIRNHHLMPVKVCFLLCWHPFLSWNWNRWKNNLKFYLSWRSSSDSVPVSRKAKRNPTEGGQESRPYFCIPTSKIFDKYHYWISEIFRSTIDIWHLHCIPKSTIILD